MALKIIVDLDVNLKCFSSLINSSPSVADTHLRFYANYSSSYLCVNKYSYPYSLSKLSPRYLSASRAFQRLGTNESLLFIFIHFLFLYIRNC
jgi:hypothetical protein